MGNVKPKIVLLGARGMLGHALSLVLGEVIALRHTDLDITNRTAVLQKMEQLQPDIIVNAAGFTKVDQCETNTTVAMTVNGLAPGYLAEAAKQQQATLVHYSTDYVFSGEQANGYSEVDQPDQPVNAYGQSKLAGEQAILTQVDASWERYYIIRTAWLFGANGPNFVDTMLQLAESKRELTVVNDQHGSPTYTQDLALATHQLLEQSSLHGIYHLTNQGVCTWYEFAQEIFRQAAIPMTIQPCSSAEFPRPAKRPTYSMLLNHKLPQLRPWQQALESYLSSRREEV